MKKVYLSIFAILFVFACGWICGAKDWGITHPPEQIFMDMVQFQEFLNECIANDPAPPEFKVEGEVFTRLKADGDIGAKTKLVWKYYGAYFAKE